MKKKPKVLVEQYDDGHKRITVGKKVVFNDNGEQFTAWTMIDVLIALGVEWNHECREGAGGEDGCEDAGAAN